MLRCHFTPFSLLNLSRLYGKIIRWTVRVDLRLQKNSIPRVAEKGKQ